MRNKVLAFVLSTTYASVAGALYAGLVRFIGPAEADVVHTFDMITYLLVGGIGTLMGPLVGTMVITWLTQSLQFLEEYRMIVFGPLLVVLVIFFPRGVVGSFLAGVPAGWRRHRMQASHRKTLKKIPDQSGSHQQGQVTMLKINNLTKRFGGLAAVNNVSIEFEANKINAIIGPNGAKSTFFNLVAGAMPPPRAPSNTRA